MAINMSSILGNETQSLLKSTCAQFNISDKACGEVSRPGGIPKYVSVALFLMVSIVAIVGNTVVVVVIYKFRRMQTFMNWMIFNLAVADMLASLFYLSIDITIEVKERWVFRELLCPILFPLRGTVIFVSVFTLV